MESPLRDCLEASDTDLPGRWLQHDKAARNRSARDQTFVRCTLPTYSIPVRPKKQEELQLAIGTGSLDARSFLLLLWPAWRRPSIGQSVLSTAESVPCR